jgi:hypothetical protein
VAKQEKSVTVFLFGGLGNQLFQYFAGLAVAEAVGARLYLKPFGQTSAQAGFGAIGIEAFHLDATFISSRLPRNIQKRMLPRLINFASWFRLQNFAWKGKTLFTDALDLDELDLSPSRNIQLVGYFQDSKYLDFLATREKEIELSLKTPSKWFKELQAIANSKRPIVVHLRRGDYFDHADTIGVLDFQYFLNALKLIPHFNNPGTDFWIFSNSLSAAKNFARFAELPESRTEIVQSPENSIDAESMLLMSLGSAIVISNSTFSWWGAFLSNETSQIVAPKKWFKTLDDPVILNQDGWKFSESIWVD